ncbi:MAG: BamA/TamA family outer membrane protein [Mariniphaga sp.]|nr:BamA/TamA family outer membrane protein [Mariniphaga sp.]MDD4225518.1 BamA/TamA family outer membrane protein [Mariniphaga sp.]
MMKKFWLVLVFFTCFFTLFAQEDVVKTGWNFGALPSVAFDADLGFQYGALVNLFQYGDGSRYPSYNHSLYFEVSRFTKGSEINRFYYDSDRLIKGLRTTLDISYLSDQAYDFFGFNGYDAVVNYDWTDDSMPDDIYKTRMFYKYNRKLFRFKLDLLGKFTGDHMKWAAGVNLLNFNIGQVNLQKLNKGKEGDDLLPDIPGLYEMYRTAGIISAEDADGGFIPELKAGLVYDSRDNRPNPMKGIWTEAVLVGVPEFLGAESSFAKFIITHRQYFTIIPRDLSLVYRLNYQTTIAGHVPFYYQTQVITSEMRMYITEGLGGMSTLRGIKRNRIVGDGYLLGNVEARWKFARFRLINNNFYLGLNGFMDFGQVTQKIDVDTQKLTVNNIYPVESTDFFNIGAEKMHISYGAGLRIAMNENFIIRVDYGISADKRDGDTGLYIGLNYLF